MSIFQNFVLLINIFLDLVSVKTVDHSYILKSLKYKDKSFTDILSNGLIFSAEPVTVIHLIHTNYINEFNKHIYEKCKSKNEKIVRNSIKLKDSFILNRKNLKDNIDMYDKFYLENSNRYIKEAYLNIKNSSSSKKLIYYELIAFENDRKLFQILLNSCGRVFYIVRSYDDKYQTNGDFNKLIFKKPIYNY